jgi:predicted nucleic acid-binding protein
MRVLLDTNVALDHLMNRMPWANDATALWQAAAAGDFQPFISAMTPVNVFYIVRKSGGSVLARQIVASLLGATGVCAIDQTVLQAAFTSPLTDYEDAVHYASAIANGMDAVVTRDPAGFTNVILPILSPSDFLRQLRMGTQ